MAKGKVCLVLIKTKKIRGANVYSGSVLMEGALTKNISAEDVEKAIQLGEVQVELREDKTEKSA